MQSVTWHFGQIHLVCLLHSEISNVGWCLLFAVASDLFCPYNFHLELAFAEVLRFATHSGSNSSLFLLFIKQREILESPANFPCLQPLDK